MTEKIKARFLVTRKTVTIITTYHEVGMVIRWKRTPDAERHLRTLIANLDKVLEEGALEVLVQDEASRLDWEIEEFFLDQDDERPDDN